MKNDLKDDLPDLKALAVVLSLLAVFLVYVFVGVSQSDLTAQAEESPSAAYAPTLEVTDEQAAVQEHRSHEAEAVEAGKVDAQGEAIDAPESEPEAVEAEEADEGWYDYQTTYYGGYTGGTTATTLSDLLNGQGRAYDNGTNYTWYFHDLGNGALDIPGETFDADGVSHDADGYIVVASGDYAKGTVIDTPYGQAKVYDSGCTSGTVDIYTNR